MQNQHSVKYLISLLWAVALAFSLFFSFDFSRRSTRGIIWSDAEGYYMYLPAVLLYGGFEEVPINTDTGQFQHFPGTSKYFTKYTYGVAMLELPFFLGAHAIATAFEEFEANAHSLPYIYAIILSGLFYGFFGCWLMRRNLARFFPGYLPDLATLAIFLGTNLFFYTTRAPGMSHVYSFFLFNVFIYFTHRFYDKSPTWPSILAIGFSFAFAVLIRPTNLLLGFYFVFYAGLSSFDWQERWKTFKIHFWKLATLPLIGFLVFIPQFLYWRYMTGSFLFYSYRDEGFQYCFEPKVGLVLFDIRNGWLFFTPLMGLALIGSFIGLPRNRYDSRVILFILAGALYAFSSWSCWWFGGAFGHRAFVEFYALLAFPLAYLFQLVLASERLYLKLLFFALVLGMIYYNLGLTYMYGGPFYNWETWRAAVKKLLLVVK